MKYFTLRSKTHKAKIIAISLIFAAIGTIFLWSSFAANPNLPGDVNNDNKVNITDLSILLSNFGKASTTVDLNGDGQVTITDLSILLTNYGKTYSGNPTPTPTPPGPTPPGPNPTPSASRPDPYCGGSFSGPIGGSTQPIPATTGRNLTVGSGKQYSSVSADSPRFVAFAPITISILYI